MLTCVNGFNCIISGFLLYRRHCLLKKQKQLFSKEIGYNEGEITDVRYTLAGRGYIWEEYWSSGKKNNLLS